jgi:Caspase domain
MVVAPARAALVVATGSYRDPALPDLRAPVQDGLDLVSVLGEPRVGGFDVRPLLDGTERDIRIAVTDLLADRRPDDLVLLYVSCHGLLDPRRRLYFAATDTRAARVAATGLDADWLTARLDGCRAQQVVILDCCYSGGFVRGAKGGGLDLAGLLTGPARGRVVLTASRPTQAAYEGDPRRPGGLLGSVFTSVLVEGIRTGAADRDGDGVITVDEAYEYAARRVRELGSAQHPQRTLLGGEAHLILARSPARTPVSHPPAPDAGRPPGPPVQPAGPGVAPGRPAGAGPRRAWVALAVVVAVLFAVVAANIAVALARMS